ncbi:TCR/Tet family MFS transporter [Microvirga sp. VF16]|uniref:TCR/Tet family MFS transporter n=1 Tax=Microvirga sp. VF16 TaxID=2807101 RepID=UPI00193E527A|nr:TCR/Tet family MFS transporter [Microvirga sp. VF16]QRM27689.1 TCR/Tet family MFS transporter [Microvirga sp. VF16]
MHAHPRRRPALSFVVISVALDLLAFGIIIPVLPRLVQELLGGETISAAQVYGLFGLTWAVTQFFGAPVLGALSDAYGRRPVILLSNLALGLDYLFMAIAPGVGWLLVGRAVGGLASSSFTTAFAYVADVTDADRRAAGFGVIGAAFAFGFIAGPALGGVLGAFDLRLPFWIAAGLCLANALYGVFVLPESLPRDKRASFVWRKANPLAALRLIRVHPEVFRVSAVLFFSNLAHEVFPAVFVLYAGHRYGWDQITIGLALAAVGIASAAVQGGLVRRVVPRMGERSTMIAGLAFGCLGTLLFGLAPSGAWIWLAIPVAALWGLFGPAAQSLMTQRIAASEQGRLQGALNSLRGVSGLIGPILFTASFAAGVSQPGPSIAWGMPFFVAAVLLLMALVPVARIVNAEGSRGRKDAPRRISGLGPRPRLAQNRA